MKDQFKQQLLDATKQVKEQYIAKTIEWATLEFASCQERSKWAEVDWCKYFGLEPQEHNSHAANPKAKWMGFPKGFHNTDYAKRYDRLKRHIRTVTSLGLDKLIEKEVANAEENFEAATELLVSRVIRKGLELATCTFSQVYLDKNIGISITDKNGKTVRAFTIIAAGLIQRPHYRYLIR